jgi:hypothetical protein
MRPTISENVQFGSLSLDAVVTTLQLAAYADPSVLAKVNPILEAEVKRLNANLDPAIGSAMSKTIAQSSATTLRPDLTAAVALKAAGDARVVAGIPPATLSILQVLHGPNNAKIAAAWTDTQAQIRAGKIKP